MKNLTTGEFNRQLFSFIAEDVATTEIEVVMATGQALELNNVYTQQDNTISNWLDENQIALADFDELKGMGAVSIRSSDKYGNQIITIDKSALAHILSQS